MFKTICALLRRKPIESQIMEVTSLSEEPKFPVKSKTTLKKATTRKPAIKKPVAKITAKKPVKKKNAG